MSIKMPLPPKVSTIYSETAQHAIKDDIDGLSEEEVTEQEDDKQDCTGEAASGNEDSEIDEINDSESISSSSSTTDNEEDLSTVASGSTGGDSNAAAFFIDFGDGPKFSLDGQPAIAESASSMTASSTGSTKSALQKSFQTYLRRKKRDLKREKRAAKRQQLSRSVDPDRLWSLRMKFLDRCRHYFGVPYKRKYWTEADPEYNSPLFLDCCGLVRRVLYDLRKDFGFKIGPWNQAYMFDTLPIRIAEDQMQPGDLVFIEAIYYSDTAKKQKHNMVHVEVWLGDGPKTIGARWQKGKVQIFDSYRFVSTSYHSQVHHFCSIDTWLQGICKSFCSDHPWKRHSSTARSNKYSIFTAATGSNSSSSSSKPDDSQQHRARRKKHRKKKRKHKKKQRDKDAEAKSESCRTESIENVEKADIHDKQQQQQQHLFAVAEEDSQNCSSSALPGPRCLPEM